MIGRGVIHLATMTLQWDARTIDLSDNMARFRMTRHQAINLRDALTIAINLGGAEENPGEPGISYD